jgi:hypothetical protein
MTIKSKSPQKTWELHSTINHCYSMNCFTAANVWVCKVYMMHSHVKWSYSGFKEPLLNVDKNMPSAFSSNPTMKVAAKPVKLWFTHKREILINCKTTIEWVPYLWLMFSKFCWNNWVFEKRVWQPQFEYFRISTIVSKYLSPPISFKLTLFFKWVQFSRISTTCS